MPSPPRQPAPFQAAALIVGQAQGGRGSHKAGAARSGSGGAALFILLFFYSSSPLLHLDGLDFIFFLPDLGVVGDSCLFLWHVSTPLSWFSPLGGLSGVVGYGPASVVVAPVPKTLLGGLWGPSVVGCFPFPLPFPCGRSLGFS